MAKSERLLYLSAKHSLSLIENDSGDIDVKYNDKNHVFDTKDGIPPKEKKIEFADLQKRKLYQNFLSTHFENLIILSGAGTSVGWGGKTMIELWEAVQTELTADVFKTLCYATGFFKSDYDFSKITDGEKDLEKLLSRANIAKEFVKKYKKSESEPEQEINIGELVSKAEKKIQELCIIPLLPKSPHEQFLNKVTTRKLKDPHVKIFTLNYDTLFEQASIKGNFTIIDGFSFSNPRTLSGRNFDHDIVYREKSRVKEEESFVSKVFHLYKPHGSVNWELSEGSESIIINENAKQPLMIFPKDSKYENSYEQPFFEMMSRFQQNIRNDNVLLICIGFSFSDKHMVTAIKEAVTQNPSFRLLIVSRTIRTTGEFKWFTERSKTQSNVTIVAEEFKDFTEHFPISEIYSEKTSSNNTDKDEAKSF